MAGRLTPLFPTKQGIRVRYLAGRELLADVVDVSEDCNITIEHRHYYG
jgi:hypothetical protein